MTAGRRRTHQAVQPSLLKGEREVQAVGRAVHPLDLLGEADLVVLLVLEEVEVEMVPLVVPLVGEDTQA